MCPPGQSAAVMTGAFLLVAGIARDGAEVAGAAMMSVTRRRVM